MGLVCFRLRGTDRLNQDLLASINGSGKLHMIPSLVKGRYIIRFCVIAEHANEADVGTQMLYHSHFFKCYYQSNTESSRNDLEQVPCTLIN
jgi:hypothetical protein